MTTCNTLTVLHYTGGSAQTETPIGVSSAGQPWLSNGPGAVPDFGGQPMINPFQPCFSAYNSANMNNVTGDGTNYSLTLDSTQINNQTCYNTSTGVFTAPVAGNYLFNIAIVSNGLGLLFTQGQVKLVTTSQTYTLSSLNIGALKDLSGDLYTSISRIVPLAQGDTVSVQFSVSGSLKTVGLNGTVNGATFQAIMLPS